MYYIHIMDANKYIYTIQCEGYYYIGSTVDVDTRIAQHNAGEGSAWTKHILTTQKSGWCILSTEPQTHPMQEDNTTKQMMARYGIACVRGGTYSQVVLQDWQLKALEAEIKHTNDTCLQCGAHGHYAKDCHIAGRAKEPRPYHGTKDFNRWLADTTCTRCGIQGHSQEKCGSICNANGTWIMTVNGEWKVGKNVDDKPRKRRVYKRPFGYNK
jgi:predicted GIY-YIG superfamily endonuclease